MELYFKPKSNKGKGIYYPKSRFLISRLIKKRPITWTELTKISKLHQIELKRILDDLLSSKEIKNIDGKYTFIQHPYWKYLDSPLRLKDSYLKKVKKVKLKDTFINDSLIILPFNEKEFASSEIKEIKEICKDIKNSTLKIKEVIGRKRARFIQNLLEKEIINSGPVFKKLLKNHIEDVVLFVSSLETTITLQDIKYLLEKRTSKISKIHDKFPYNHKAKFLKIILKVSKETDTEDPIILNTPWI